MLGEIKNIWADFSENTVNQGYFIITILHKNSDKTQPRSQGFSLKALGTRLDKTFNRPHAENISTLRLW
jgi:hypothetical protein